MSSCECGNRLGADDTNGLCEWCELERDARVSYALLNEHDKHRWGVTPFMGATYCEKCGLHPVDTLDMLSTCTNDRED